MPLLDIMPLTMLDVQATATIRRPPQVRFKAGVKGVPVSITDPFDAPLVPVLAWCPRTGRSLNLRSGRWHSKPHSSFPEAVYLLLHLLP